MVSEVPSFQEFFGLTNKELSYSDWVDDSEDDDEIRFMINSILVILQEFYTEHHFDSEQEWIKDSIKKEFNNLNKELYDSLIEFFDDFSENAHHDFDIQYNLPAGHVVADINYDDVLNSGVDSVVNQLYDEIKNKADFYNTTQFATGVFAIEANFKRAIKRLTNLISYNAHHNQKVIERTYLEFVYGTDALFDWVPSGINTCEWCYMIADSSPLPLSQLPVDHINGRCSIVPHNPNDFTEEYLILQR